MDKKEMEKWKKDLFERYDVANKELKQASEAYDNVWDKFDKVRRELREFAIKDLESRMGNK